MNSRNFESIMHPVRMKIILSLTEKGERTTQELAQLHPEIPPATLYRQIARLQRDGVIAVAKERRVNGITEKTYCIKENLIGQLDSLEEPEQILSLFYQFMLTHAADFQKYLFRERIDLVKDGAGFRYTTLFLNGEQFREFYQELGGLIEKWSVVPPAEDGKLKRFSTIFVPLDE